MLAPSGDALPGFSVFEFGGDAHLYRAGGGTIHAELRGLNGDILQEESVVYSAAAHRWWGFREAGDTLYWETSNNGTDCVGSSVDGEWVFDPADGLDTGYCVVSGSYRHDLRGSNVSIKLSQAPPASEDLLLGFEVEAKGGFAAFVVVRGMVFANLCPGNNCVELAAAPLDGSFGYWRIREQDSVFFWEKSTDGSDWTVVATSSDTFDVRLAVFSVFAVIDGAATTATMAIDDLNLP